VIPDFNLQVADGEFVVLVGPSGCGKSTLLRIIAGLEEPTGGEIRIGQRRMNGVPPKDRNVAMVFQNYALYPHMNVFDNLAFGLKLRKVPKEEIRRRVASAAEVLEIRELLQRKPKELSGGQRQRVALGRAIVRDPQVFLFDEPLSNLDAKLRVQMRAEIKNLHRRLNTTMVYVTHDQVEAMTMGDRIVVLKDGVTQQVGTPHQVYHDPANRFVAGFIGSPPMNFLPGRLEQDAFVTEGVVFPLPGWNPERLPQAEVVLGIRPERIQVGEPGVALPLLVAEPLGSETLLYLRAGSGTVVAKVSTGAGELQREEVPIRLDPDALLFFHPETGARLPMD
jgi:multiple sugar transport system ATP-binding protein